MTRLLSERVDAMLGGLGWAETQRAWFAIRAEIPESPQKACVADTWDSDLSEVINTHRPPPIHRSDIANLMTLRTWLQGYEAGAKNVADRQIALGTKRGRLDGRVLAAHPYPATGDVSFVRTTAHALKRGDAAAINRAAADMARLIVPIQHRTTRDAILIPLPGSDGTTAVNRALADAIAIRAEANVFDVLTGPLRERHYTRKKAGKPMTAAEIGTAVRAHGAMQIPKVLAASIVYLVDNVCDTGVTAEAAMDALTAAGSEAPVFVLVWATTNRHVRA